MARKYRDDEEEIPVAKRLPLNGDNVAGIPKLRPKYIYWVVGSIAVASILSLTIILLPKVKVAALSFNAVSQERPLPDEKPIHIGDIFMGYENEASGDLKYKDKWITFCGSAKFIKKNSDGYYVVGIRYQSEYPHAGEVIFLDSESNAISTIPTQGRVAPEIAVAECVIQAKCRGRKSEVQLRYPGMQGSRFVVLFEYGKLISITPK